MRTEKPYKAVESSEDEQVLAFKRKVIDELDHSCDALDGATLSRLNQIRHTALERKVQKRNVLLPFGGFVTACVLVLAVSLNYQGALAPESESANLPLEDLEILSAGESLDFYEDYEFYQWLADNEVSV